MGLHSLEAVAGGALMAALVVAGITLTIYGLRNDRRERRRTYRRRGHRFDMPEESRHPRL